MSDLRSSSGRFPRLPARQGAFWVLVALALPRLAGAIFTIVLRRFLGPGISGTFDLAYAPYRFLDNFRNFGTGPALIYQQTLNREVANTAWTLNMLAAVTITLVAQILAGPIARFYGHPQIEGIFRVLSIAYVFSSIASVHLFLLLRDQNFRARAMPSIGQVIVAGVTAVLFAIWGFGVGVLVARELASAVAGAVLLWVVYPFWPRIHLNPRFVWQLLRYGAWIGAGMTVLYLSQNVDVFIGGRIIHNTSDIGFYTTSWRVAFLAAGTFTIGASTMVFPALSRLQNTAAALHETLLKSLRQLGLLMFPSATLLAALAPVIIVPLLGTKFAAYQSSFAVLSLLAIYAGNRTMLAIFFEGYKSVGQPWLIWAYNSIKLVVLIPAMIIGAEHGILGMAITYIPVQLVEIPAAMLLARRVLAIGPRAVWEALRVALIATVVMAAVAIGAERLLLGDLHAGDNLTLGACLAIGAAVYLGSLLLLDRSVFVEARSVLLQGL